MKKVPSVETGLAAIVLAGALMSSPALVRAAAPVDAQVGDSSLTSAAQSRLNKKQFKDVRVSVSNGIATLTGTVDLYEFKADAQKAALHTKGVTAVRNEIQVSGQNVADIELQSKLAEKLAYDRVGYGNVFDAITVGVNNGVVTLGGHVHNYPNRDSALGTVATTAGVKDVVDEVEVDPVSTMDDQTRFAVARSVYSFPTLNKYGMNPAMPIRISVQNGNVELYGTVDSKSDKEVAYIRANSVPGVFSVKNYLQVEGQGAEHQ